MEIIREIAQPFFYYILLAVLTFIIFSTTEFLSSNRKNIFIKNNYKTLLAVAFFQCMLGGVPYWYYILIRALGMFGLIYFAILDYNDGVKFTPILFMFSAIIINPIIKLPFDKITWNKIDLILAMILFLSMVFEKRLTSKTDKGSNT